jgi:ribosomal protein S18 acetylase RimI-like enzyme
LGEPAHLRRCAGRRGRQALFADAFPDLTHRTFTWDLTDGTLGAAVTEFPGYELDHMVGLVATPAQLRPHPRANSDLAVRTLEANDPAWAQVLALWEANNAADEQPHPTEHYRSYATSRIGEMRRLIADGRGVWCVALDGGEVVGSLGLIVTDGRARYQSVDTRLSHRRRGVASRLVVEAAERAAARWAVDSFVIAAVPGYHAIGIYEGLGFVPVERLTGVCRWATGAQ